MFDLMTILNSHPTLRKKMSYQELTRLTTGVCDDLLEQAYEAYQKHSIQSKGLNQFLEDDAILQKKMSYQELTRSTIGFCDDSSNKTDEKQKRQSKIYPN